MSFNFENSNAPAKKDFERVYPALPSYLQTAYRHEWNEEIDALYRKVEQLGYEASDSALKFALQATFIEKILPIFVDDEESLFNITEKMPHFGAVELCFNHPSDPAAYLHLFWYTPNGCFMEDTIFIAVTSSNSKLSQADQAKVEEAISSELEIVIEKISPTWANKTTPLLVELSDRVPHPQDPDLGRDASIGRAIYEDEPAKVRFSTWKYNFCYYLKLFESMIDGEFEEFVENGIKKTQDSYLGCLKYFRNNLRFLQYFRKGTEAPAPPPVVVQPAPVVTQPPRLRFKHVVSNPIQALKAEVQKAAADKVTAMPPPPVPTGPVLNSALPLPATATKQVPKLVFVSVAPKAVEPPAEPAKPAEPIKPVEPEKPVEPAKPAKPAALPVPANSSSSKESNSESSSKEEEEEGEEEEEEEVEEGEEGEEEEGSEEQASSSGEEEDEEQEDEEDSDEKRLDTIKASMTPEMLKFRKSESWKAGFSSCFFCRVEISVCDPLLKKDEIIEGGTLVCADCRSFIDEAGRPRNRNKSPSQIAGFFSLARVEIEMDDEIFAHRGGVRNKRCDMCMRKDWKIHTAWKKGRKNTPNSRAATVCYLCAHKRITFMQVMSNDGLVMRAVKHKEPEMAAFKAFYAKCKMSGVKKQIVDSYKAMYPDFDEDTAYAYIAQVKKAKKAQAKSQKRKAQKKKSSANKRTKVEEEEVEPPAKSKKVLAEKPVVKEKNLKTSPKEKEEELPLKRKNNELASVMKPSSAPVQSPSKRVKVVEDIQEFDDPEPEDEEVGEEDEDEEQDIPIQRRKTYRNGARIIFADNPSKPDVEYRYLTVDDFQELFIQILAEIKPKPHRRADDAIADAFGSIIDSPDTLANFCKKHESLTKKLGFFGMGFWIERLKRLSLSMFDTTCAIHYYITTNDDLKWIAGKIRTLRCESVNTGVSQFSNKQIDEKLKELKSIICALNKDAHQMLLDHIWTLQQ